MKKDEITIKKKGWKDISINEYYALQDAIKETKEPLEQSVALLAVLCECTADEIYALPMSRINELTKSIGWVLDFKFDRRFNSKKLTVAGKRYDVCVNLQDMTVSQYIDFQTFYGKGDFKQYMGNILTCFLVPEGKGYCEGYDATALAEEFRDTISITLANAVCFFFVRRLVSSTRAMCVFLEIMMKKMKKKASPQIMEKIAEMEAELAIRKKFLTQRSSSGGWL